MLREHLLFLQDIRSSCNKIMTYTKAYSRQAFFQSQMVYDATLHNIAIIGEAVKQIPDAIRGQYPDIEWRKIGRMRDIVIHHYFGIDENIVWDVVQNKIPALLEQVEKILAPLEQSNEKGDSD